MVESRALGRGERLVMRVRRVRVGVRLPISGRCDVGRIGLLAGEDVEIGPGEVKLVGTGCAVELPPGTEGQIRPESGLAGECGVTVLNSPGTVDSGYRGEVGVILINHGERVLKVERGMRIAELVVRRVVEVEVVEADTLSVAERGEDGFGSSG